MRVIRRTGSEAPQIDQLDPQWLGTASAAVSLDLLPSHSWLGLDGLRQRGLIANGASWVTCADLVVEPVDPPRFRRPLLSLRGLASMARHDGVIVGAVDLPAYTGFVDRLEVVSEGTRLVVADVSGWSDRWFPSVGTYIRFSLPDGREFTLHTFEAHEVERNPSGQEVWEEGIAWWMLACAAVIVPAEHPFAGDSGLVDKALSRIGSAASAPLSL